MSALDLLSAGLIGAGAVFFVAGTVGLIRFPGLLARLHAIAKADNFGLSLVVLGLVVQAESRAAAAELVLVWAISLMSAVTAAHLMFHVTLRTGAEEQDRERDRERERAE